MKLTIHANPQFPEVRSATLPWIGQLAVLAGEIGEAGDVVELSFTSDEEIRLINAEWRGKDSATDVLSFHYGRDVPDEAAAELDPVGEIIVSVERAREQALALGLRCEEEISLLVIHGLFHIIGMDHEDEVEAALMADAEQPFRRRLAEYFADFPKRS